jgi:hypothetical protein
MSNNLSSMFAAIKDALNKPSESNFKDILKFEPGKTYLVRLLPNIKAPEQTFFHYFHHSWKSFATGQFVSYVSPTSWGERCPISEENFRIYKQGSPEEKEKGKAIYRKENYLVNVYVVSDPTNPENDGKVKVMRYGNQIHKIIRNAIDGDDAAEFGEKIFNLTEQGCNFRIKCEKKSDTKDTKKEFVEYTSSRFLSPSKIDGLDEQKIKDVYNNIFDLTQILPSGTYDELKLALEEHFYGKVAGESEHKHSSKPTTEVKTPVQEAAKSPVSNNVPSDFESIDPVVTPPAPVVKKEEVKKEEVKKATSVGDVSIDDLLKGLDLI